MSSKYIVYALVDPRTNTVRYIGKSARGLHRPKAHTAPSYLSKSKGHKGNWLRQLKEQRLDPVVRVLEETNASDLASCEMFWIAQARGLGWPLTNATKGGEGTLGRVVSEEQREHLRSIHKGRAYHHTPCSDAKREALSRAHKGRPKTKAHTEKMRNTKRGQKLSEEHKKKIGAGLRGRLVSEETRRKIGAANRAAWAQKKAGAL